MQLACMPYIVATACLRPASTCSLHRSHGPVWRTMLAVDRERSSQCGGRAAAGSTEYGYSLHWPSSRESACFDWRDMPAELLAMGGGSSSSNGTSREQPLLSGPLWLGPLHSLSHLQQVRAEAEARGWLGTEASGSSSSGCGPGSGGPAMPTTRKGGIGSLRQLLGLMLEEAEAEEAAATWLPAGAVQAAGGRQQQQQQQQQDDQQQDDQQQQQAGGLPPWYLRMNDVGRAGALTGPPSRDALAEELWHR